MSNTWVVLPGMDGTGKLLASFAAAASSRDIVTQCASYPTDEKLTYAMLEEWMYARLPREGEYILVGESFSGPLALKIAASKPRGLIAVALVGTFLRAPIAPWLRMIAFMVRPVIFSLPPPSWIVRWFLVGRDASASLVTSVKQAVRSVRPSVLSHRMNEILSVDAREAFRTCPVPLLWIDGAQDKLVRPSGESELRALRPDLRCHTIAAPHFILERAPDAAAAIILDFVRSVKASRT